MVIDLRRKIVREYRLIDFTALLSTHSNIQVETPSSRDWTEASTTEPSATTNAIEGQCFSVLRFPSCQLVTGNTKGLRA